MSLLALSPRWDRLYPLAVRRTAVLLTASFRFHLAMDTLAVRLAVPTIRACSGLAPPSLRNSHHSHFACAYALRAMPDAPNRRGSRAGASFALAAVQEYIACRANLNVVCRSRRIAGAPGLRGALKTCQPASRICLSAGLDLKSTGWKATFRRVKIAISGTARSITGSDQPLCSHPDECAPTPRGWARLWLECRQRQRSLPERNDRFLCRL